jgi:hypothetical protein
MSRLCLLILLALSLQGSALRTCIVEKVVTGTDCHDQAAAGPVDGVRTPDHASCPGDQESCVCKIERFAACGSRQSISDAALCESFAFHRISVLPVSFASPLPACLDDVPKPPPRSLPLLT